MTGRLTGAWLTRRRAEATMPTIPGSLRSTARRVPDAPALVFGDRAFTDAELDAAVDRTASALAGLGLRRGDRFALMATNSDRFVVSFYAALRCGAIVALFDHHRVMWAGFIFVASCGMRAGDRFLHVAPLYHAAELGIMLIPGTTPRDGASITPDEVRAFPHDRLTGYKIPHDVITGAIPRNPSGKILKHKLREAVAQPQASASRAE